MRFSNRKKGFMVKCHLPEELFKIGMKMSAIISQSFQVRLSINFSKINIKS